MTGFTKVWRLGVLLLIVAVMQAPTVAAAESSGVNDVKAFGAKGDGKADDTAAIQAAIDGLPEAGGTVSLPPGTYMVNRLLLKGGASLVGAGRTSTMGSTCRAARATCSASPAPSSGPQPLPGSRRLHSRG